MKIFGFQVSRTKSPDDQPHFGDAEGGWWPVIREGFAGAWQHNITIKRETLIAFTAVYACVARISTDIGKLPAVLKAQGSDGIWVPITRNSPWLPLFKKPNDYQTWSQFAQQWIISKLLAGNAYVWKARDNRGVVRKLYVLDPTRVRPMVTPDGSVYYALGYDNLNEQLDPTLVVPASEIIHDRMPALFHPLIGTSPIFACGMAAMQGHSIQKSSAAFFKNMAQPSGVLTAPGSISQPVADRLKADWASKFSGKDTGMVAVLGDGLTFAPMTMSAIDAQVIEQLKWSGETVCSAFMVPPFMVGLAPPPTYTNIEAMTQQYWSQCLQSHIQDIECLLDQGLELDEADTDDDAIGVELDLDLLLRMDTATRYKTWKDAISGGWMSPNEARAKEDMKAVVGGDTPYMQQQNYSLGALAKRDAAAPAPATAAPGDGSAPKDGEPKPEGDDGAQSDDSVKMLESWLDIADNGITGDYISRKAQELMATSHGALA